MTLKEELETLRGEPIEAFNGDPMDIPCIETSDVEKLCKHPVVSVHMITYNHEPYIRQAIEGVMMQKADFEFELVIGEDCSQDKTREICFEYQKKYPDKIRVLWWHENVSKLGGNGRRVTARCRGEFIAFCEGDDYWTDPLKLKKQKELLEASKAIGCVAFNTILEKNGRFMENIYERVKFVGVKDFEKHYFHTSTYFFDFREFRAMMLRYSQMPYWFDTIMFQCMASVGKIALLPEIVSVRRYTGTGIATSLSDIGRIILNLSQNIPLYLYGPRIYRKFFARGILTSASGYFYLRRNQNVMVNNEEKERGRVMSRIFYSVFLGMLYSPYAWKRFLYMMKWRFLRV